jgi:hypothetical protein
MDRLAAESGETVNLAVPEPTGGGLVNVAQVDSTHIVGIGLWKGRRMPAHCTANGKALLAHRRESQGGFGRFYGVEVRPTWCPPTASTLGHPSDSGRPARSSVQLARLAMSSPGARPHHT